ncbi:hypothetical protein J2T18_002604 [Paenibacillus polymyxa]|nr:hypothetical protein [Paenibacillus polymyxa]
MQWAMRYIRHRLLVVYELERNRYDLSSFFLGHNRSFCQLMEYWSVRLSLKLKLYERLGETNEKRYSSNIEQSYLFGP